MLEVKGLPPIYDSIVAVFPAAANPNVVFAWGDKIYVSSGAKLPSHILAHESVHGARQAAAGVELWWSKYLEDKTFRLDEEVVAHRAEYRDLCRQSADRERRNAYLHFVAAKLAAPLYHNMITQREARQLLVK